MLCVSIGGRHAHIHAVEVIRGMGRSSGDIFDGERLGVFGAKWTAGACSSRDSALCGGAASLCGMGVWRRVYEVMMVAVRSRGRWRQALVKGTDKGGERRLQSEVAKAARENDGAKSKGQGQVMTLMKNAERICLSVCTCSAC